VTGTDLAHCGTVAATLPLAPGVAERNAYGMRSRHRSHDLMGVAMLLGAIAGFAVGALNGFGGPDLSSPVVLPLVGALCGVVVAGLPFVFAGVLRHRREDRLRQARHDTFRLRAHDGWIEGIDLDADAPVPAPRRPRT
jgi:hypothetical protein